MSGQLTTFNASKRSIQITSPLAIYKAVTHEVVLIATKWGGKRRPKSVPQTQNYNKNE
jgi:hypothetical protein